MSSVLPADETRCSASVPQLLWELPSRPSIFFGNLRDLVFPQRLARLELESTPAEFWPDVFVSRGLPWAKFFQSSAYHVVAVALAVGLAHLFAMQPRVVPSTTFDHSEVVYYRPSEYLPPLDTRRESRGKPEKADPEFSTQPIISVPREADNARQTIVTPPSIRVKRDVAMPNIVAWSSNAQRPQLAIPPAPVTPAAEITRLAPRLEASVAPPPEEARLAHRRNSPILPTSVAAPPTGVSDSNAHGTFPGLQPTLIVPPSDVPSAPRRPLGELSIAPSAVVAPAPELPVTAQRSIPGGGLAGTPQVLPPPAALSASGRSGASAGPRGQIIALNLHPAVEAPPDPAVGNRRGTFAATPAGHAGASGNPGSPAEAGSASHGNNGKEKSRTGVPAGLYVGSPLSPASSVAGDPAARTATNTASPNLAASVHPPRVTAAHPSPAESTAKLSQPERAVFGNRRFYSVMMNMPNLNSSGGSWVIRFAELNQDSTPHDENAPAADISQPMATRTVDPAYPAQLMRENVTGTVILYAVIHADGSVGNVRVLRGVDDRLDRFASEAVAQWKFEPATKNGSPVDVEATFKIPFRPSHLGTNF